MTEVFVLYFSFDVKSEETCFFLLCFEEFFYLSYVNGYFHNLLLGVNRLYEDLKIFLLILYLLHKKYLKGFFILG